MNKVVLYIKDSDDVFQAVDLFEDETISVTSKIQDIRDISKVFTDFSQSFTLPASKKNNKVFKHFYNYFISEGAFDARKKVDAKLEINYIPFRDGKIFLNGVKMKENKPFAYNITFYGNTVTLKDLFGDDELSQLNYLNQWTHPYNADNVKTGLTTGILVSGAPSASVTDIIYPLISHTKRLYFNSDDNHSASTISGDLSYFDSQGNNNANVALEYTDLKPAVKVTRILEAIESQYDVEFTGFFDTTPISNLYLWMSREKGQIGGTSGADNSKTLGTWFKTGGDTITSVSSDGTELTYNDDPFADRVEFRLTIIPQSGFENVSYSLETYLSGELYSTDSNQTGRNDFEIVGDGVEFYGNPVKYILKTTDAFTFLPSIDVLALDRNQTEFEENFSCGIISSLSQVIIAAQLPKIKVSDFFTGLLKMFNLIIYYEDNRSDADYGKIIVKSLDDYYNDNPSIFDITKYVDSSNTDIESTIPFSEVNFNYEEGKTLLMKQHKEAFNDDFGDEEFRPANVDRGKPYEVKVPFEHFKFERLIDENSSGIGLTDIQWGYSANDNFKPDADASPPTANYEPVLMKPALFYGIRITGLSGDGRINWNGTTHEGLTSYWKPSNTNESGSNGVDETEESGTTTSTVSNKLVDSNQNFNTNVTVGDYVINETDSTQTTVTAIDSGTQLSLADDIFTSGEDYVIYHAPEFTLNFDNEIDEWNQIDYGGETNSLFKKWYKTYIEDAFNAKKRIFKLTAHLPNSILLNYSLNDRFQIGDKVFTINSIDTNLKTGESKLELLNVL